MSTDKAKRRPQPGNGARTATSASTTIQRSSRPRPLLAPASVYAPLGRRRWRWYAYRCRTCGAYQFGRAKTLDAVIRVRRADCGHEVSVMIVRTYGTAA
jgi:hypothetical protein